MPVTAETIEAPLTPEALAQRWQAMCTDPTFADVPGKIELTEWGEILLRPVGIVHGVATMSIGRALHRALGGRTMCLVGIATSIGIRAPDVAWCSDAWYARHPEDAPLSSAPELCVEVASPSNPRPKLREKVAAYLEAGALEAWIVFPASRRIEIYGPEGARQVSEFNIDLQDLLA